MLKETKSIGVLFIESFYTAGEEEEKPSEEPKEEEAKPEAPAEVIQPVQNPVIAAP